MTKAQKLSSRSRQQFAGRAGWKGKTQGKHSLSHPEKRKKDKGELNKDGGTGVKGIDIEIIVKV